MQWRSLVSNQYSIMVKWHLSQTTRHLKKSKVKSQKPGGCKKKTGPTYGIFPLYFLFKTLNESLSPDLLSLKYIKFFISSSLKKDTIPQTISCLPSLHQTAVMEIRIWLYCGILSDFIIADKWNEMKNKDMFFCLYAETLITPASCDIKYSHGGYLAWQPAGFDETLWRFWRTDYCR